MWHMSRPSDVGVTMAPLALYPNSETDPHFHLGSQQQNLWDILDFLPLPISTFSSLVKHCRLSSWPLPTPGSWPHIFLTCFSASSFSPYLVLHTAANLSTPMPMLKVPSMILHLLYNKIHTPWFSTKVKCAYPFTTRCYFLINIPHSYHTELPPVAPQLPKTAHSQCLLTPCPSEECPIPFFILLWVPEKSLQLKPIYSFHA